MCQLYFKICLLQVVTATWAFFLRAASSIIQSLGVGPSCNLKAVTSDIFDDPPMKPTHQGCSTKVKLKYLTNAPAIREELSKQIPRKAKRCKKPLAPVHFCIHAAPRHPVRELPEWRLKKRPAEVCPPAVPPQGRLSHPSINEKGKAAWSCVSVVYTPNWQNSLFELFKKMKTLHLLRSCWASNLIINNGLSLILPCLPCLL